MRVAQSPGGRNLLHRALYGKPYALNIVDGVVYTASAQGCGGQPNAFYSFDLATKKASIFQPAGGGLWGRRGDAIDPEGRVYIGTGDARFDATTRSLGNGIVAVKIDANKQLQLADYFAPKNANWMQRRDLDVNVTPMVFDYKGTKFLVGTSKECRLWVLDRDNLGGEDHRTPLYTSPLICNDIQAFDAKGVWGSLSAWVDAAGTQWIVVPFWGPVSKEYHAPRRVRPADDGRRRRDEAATGGGEVEADARVAIARHRHGGRGDHRGWRRLRVWGG